jgi:hypothetical protein
MTIPCLLQSILLLLDSCIFTYVPAKRIAPSVLSENWQNIYFYNAAHLLGSTGDSIEQLLVEHRRDYYHR